MGNKNGALFAKSLFGYRRKDVIEYIRNVDAEHADEISRINYEKDCLQDRLNIAELKMWESEDQLKKERLAMNEKINKLTQEYDKKIAELSNAFNAQKDKLADSENRASSYLKLVDSSSLRAENAEAELTVLAAAVEDYKTEISEMKAKLDEKEAELRRATEFDALAKKLLESNGSRKQSELASIFSFFKKSRHNK